MVRLTSAVKETLSNTVRVVSSKEGMKKLLGISLYRNAFYLMLNSVVGAATGFVFWMIAARFYTAVDVGLAAAIIAAVGLLVSLSNLGFGLGLIKFLPEAKDKATPMINSSLTIATLASLVTALIFLAGLSFWSPAIIFIRQHPIFFACFVLFTIASTLYGLLGQVFIAKRRAKFTFIQGMITGALKIPIPIILVAFFGAFGIFASVGIATSVAMLVAILWFLPRVQKGYIPLPTIHKQIINDIAHYSLGSYLADLLWLTPGFLFPLMVVNILGAEMNAYFYIAWAIAGVLFMIPLSISLSLFAEGSYERSLLRANTLKSLKLCLLILLPAILLTFAIGDKLLLLFGQAYSQNATTLLWLLALSALPLTVNCIFISIKRIQKDIKGLIAVSAAITSIALGLSYFLMGNMGILGIGVGWTVGQTIVAIVVSFPFAIKLYKDLSSYR